MKMTAFERILSNLPPENQAAAALQLRDLGTDPNGPFYTLYAGIFDKMDRDHRAQMAAAEMREKELRDYLANAQSASQQTICSEVGRLHPESLWRQIVVHRVTGALLSLIIIVVATPIAVHLATRHELALTRKTREEDSAAIRRIIDEPSAFVAHAKYSTLALDKGDNMLRQLVAIFEILKLPHARTAIVDRHLTIIAPASELTTFTENGEMRIQFKRMIPELDGLGISIEEDLDAAKKGKLQR